MKKIIQFLLFFIYFFLFISFVDAAIFQSNATGNWNDASPTTWTITSGVDADGIIDLDDDVIVLSGHTITVNISGAICNTLTINSGGIVTISTAGGGKDLTVNSTLQIDGTLTIGDAANRFLDAKNNVIIGSTGTLNNQRNFIMYATKTFQILGSGTYIHNPNTSSDDTMFSLATEDFSASSNVTISTWVNTTTALTANMTGNYGNLTLNFDTGMSSWEQDGNLGIVNIVQGNLTIGTNCRVTLDNTKTTDITVTIDGNLTVDGELWVKWNVAGNIIMNVGGQTTFNGTTFYIDYSDNGNVTFNTVGFRQTAGIFSGIYSISTGEGEGNLTFNNTGALEISGGTFYGINQTSANTHGTGIFNFNSVNFTGGGVDLYRAGITDGKSITINCTNNFSLNFASASDYFVLAGIIDVLHNPVFNFTVGGDFITSGNSAGAYFVSELGIGDETIAINGNMNIGGGDIYFNGNETQGFEHDITMTIGTVPSPKNLTVSAGKLRMSSQSGAASVTVTGNMLVSGGEASVKVLAGTGALNINGTLTLNGGTFYLHKSTTATGDVVATTVDGDFSHTAGTLTFDGSGTSTATHTLTAKGNWSNSVAAWALGKGIVIFNGSAAQTIGGTQATTFYNLTINNTSVTGATLAQPVTVGNGTTGTLTLSDGYFYTDATNVLTMAAGSSVSPVGGLATSFVDGPMKKTGTTDFIFPTGDDVGNDGELLGNNIWARIAITSLSGAETFTANYFFTQSPDFGSTKNAPLTKISGLEYWTLNRSGAANAKVTLYWENATQSGIDNCPDLTVARFNGTNWVEEAATAGGTCSGSGNGTVLTDAVVSSFSPFTFGSRGAGNPLPIELLYFTGINVNDVNLLQWATASEINNDYFTLEHSTDAINYKTIAKIEGQGNSSVTAEYFYADENYLRGKKNYYKLKQTDFDGTTAYTSTIVVIDNKNSMEQSVTVNFSDKNLVVNFSSAEEVIYELSVYDINGKLIMVEKLNGIVEHQSFQKNIPAGLYFYIISNNKYYLQSGKFSAFN